MQCKIIYLFILRMVKAYSLTIPSYFKKKEHLLKNSEQKKKNSSFLLSTRECVINQKELIFNILKYWKNKAILMIIYSIFYQKSIFV